MGQLINSRVNQIYASKVPQLTRELSARSKCVIVTIARNPCPNCKFDPTSNASSGVYKPGGPQPFTSKVCPVCKAAGKITTETRLQIPANIRWGVKPQKPDQPEPEGFVPLDQVRIKAEVKYYDLLYNADHFIIDGIRCSRFGHPKKRGLLNYVICTQFAQIDK